MGYTEIKKGIHKKTCHKCSKNILIDKEKYVLLGTFNLLNQSDELLYFHFNCWVDYYTSRVESRARAIVKDIQGKAIKVFDNPAIKGLLSQVQGSDQALSMLKTPLDKKNDDIVIKITENPRMTDLKKQIKEKNGRKNRGK